MFLSHSFFFFFAHFQPVTSLSGVGGVVGTPREDIECELCAESLSGRKKEEKTEDGRGGWGGGVSAVIFIGTKFATFSYETEALSWN